MLGSRNRNIPQPVTGSARASQCRPQTSHLAWYTLHPSVTQALPCAQAASANVSARETRVRAAEEQLGTLRTQVGQQKAVADSRQASLEAQAVELQARSSL